MKRYLILIFIFIRYFSIHGQENSMATQVQKGLDSLWIQRPVEKLYLQLDKDQYVPGEIIWFKAYLLEGKAFAPSYLSTVVYVDVWNPQDSLIARKTISIVNGIGTGDIELGRTFAGGIYQIKAYTQWMRNYQTPFQMPFRILNPVEEIEPISLDQGKPDIQFLPESGSLLAGCNNRVAFKALGPDGLGIAITGRLKDDTGSDILSVEAEHRGMGSFSFIPESGKRYSIEVEWGGNTYPYSLPEVEESGYILTVVPSPFITQIEVQAQGVDPSSVVQLVGIMRNRLNLALRTRLEGGKASLAIPNSSFPTGVLQLTLLDPENRPLCERMVWIDKEDQLNIDIDAPSTAYSKRSSVEIALSTTSQRGENLATLLAASVVEARGIWKESPARSSLKAHMLLGSEAKGSLEAPWEYFHFKEKAPFLDLVMLTHFWRKISWEEVADPYVPPPKHLIQQGLTIRGKVLRNKKKPLANSKVILMMDNMFNMVETRTDYQGNFQLEGLDFVDTTRLMLQARNENNKARPATFELEELSYEAAPKAILYAATPFTNRAYIRQNVQNRANLDMLMGAAQYELDEVAITRRKTPKEIAERGTRLYREADATVDMEGLEYRQNVIEALKGKIPGVDIRGFPGNYTIQVRGSSSLVLSNEPLFLVDGMATDILYVENIPMPFIDYVDVLKGTRAAIFGEQGANGVIAIYTKQGLDAISPEQDALRGIFRPKLKGFSINRTFYSPNYRAEQSQEKIPDLRSTLLWQPEIISDSTGTAHIRFFTGDLPGRYQIRVEGIGAGGRMGYGEAWIEVK